MRRKNAMKWAMLPTAATLILALTGCTPDVLLKTAGLGGLPAAGQAITDRSEVISNMWNYSWLILWAVGIIAWGLMIFAIIAYRRRKGDTALPVQLRYNNPIEVLFTVVPLIMVIGFFAFTAKTMAEVEKPYANPDVKIEVVGKQWAWDFNYVNANVYDSGVQLEGKNNAQLLANYDKKAPVLWVPQGKTVEVDLTSRDVVHSFWVVDFLYKKDVFPGKVNKIYFTPQKLGTYDGKCAELCGEYHSMMLFKLKIVTQAEYDAHMAQLAAQGNVGQLDDTLNRQQNLPADDPTIRG
ncbi:MAG: cytochrome c oxidase subunit II [Micrococcales bacterium]